MYKPWQLFAAPLIKRLEPRIVHCMLCSLPLVTCGHIFFLSAASTHELYVFANVVPDLNARERDSEVNLVAPDLLPYSGEKGWEGKDEIKKEQLTLSRTFTALTQTVTNRELFRRSPVRLRLP